jgi:hypothetical protein
VLSPVWYHAFSAIVVSCCQVYEAVVWWKTPTYPKRRFAYVFADSFKRGITNAVVLVVIVVEGGMELSSSSDGKERSDSSGIDTRDLMPPDGKPSSSRSDALYSPPAHAPSPTQPTVTSSSIISQIRSASPAAQAVLTSVRSSSPRQSASSAHAVPVTSDYVEVALDGDIGEGSGSFFGGLRSTGGSS